MSRWNIGSELCELSPFDAAAGKLYAWEPRSIIEIRLPWNHRNRFLKLKLHWWRMRVLKGRDLHIWRLIRQLLGFFGVRNSSQHSRSLPWLLFAAYVTIIKRLIITNMVPASWRRLLFFFILFLCSFRRFHRLVGQVLGSCGLSRYLLPLIFAFLRILVDNFLEYLKFFKNWIILIQFIMVCSFNLLFLFSRYALEELGAFFFAAAVFTRYVTLVLAAISSEGNQRFSKLDLSASKRRRPLWIGSSILSIVIVLQLPPTLRTLTWCLQFSDVNWLQKAFFLRILLLELSFGTLI